MQEWFVPVALAALAVLTLVLVAGLAATRRQSARELRAARAEIAGLRTHLTEVERRIAAPARPVAAPAPATGFVITHVGEPDPADAVVVRPDAPLFADLVLRETVVKAAALAHGLRVGLGAESRNRIRFEMRREVRRARKQRRSDLKEARRAWEAGQRAGLDDEDAA